MSKLFIQSLGPDLYDICYYDDKTGERKAHKENWKVVCFKTEKEAEERLAAVEAERKREDEAKPFTMEEAEAFVKKHEWTFATTYAKTAPHEYLVKARLSESQKKQYERFVATMKANSVEAYFYTHKNNYFILGDNYYWFMGQHENMSVDLINRTKTEYLEFKDGVYRYSPEKAQEGIKKREEWEKKLNQEASRPRRAINFQYDEKGQLEAYADGEFSGYIVDQHMMLVHEEEVTVPGTVIQHFMRCIESEENNHLYRVIGVGNHTETDERLVVYQALFGDRKTYIQPYYDFLSIVDHKKHPNIRQVFTFERYEGKLVKYKSLTRFIPKLEGANFGDWIIDHENDGTPEHPIHMPFVHYHQAVVDLVEAIHRYVYEHENTGIKDYRSYIENKGIEYRDETIANLDVSKLDGLTVVALMLTIVREDRFCEGLLLDFCKNGCMTKWLKRLKEIDDAPDSSIEGLDS